MSINGSFNLMNFMKFLQELGCVYQRVGISVSLKKEEAQQNKLGHNAQGKYLPILTLTLNLMT